MLLQNNLTRLKLLVIFLSCIGISYRSQHARDVNANLTTLNLRASCGRIESIDILHNFLFKRYCNDCKKYIKCFLTRLHLIEKENIISLVRNKLEDYFKEKFRKKIANSWRLNLYSSMKDDFKEEQYISDVKYYKYRSAIAKFKISAHTFPIEKR